MRSKQYAAVFWAILAAVLYAISLPVSKILLTEVPPTLMAAFLYLGAGLGMAVLAFIKKGHNREQKEARLTRRELPFTLAMIVLDIAAPIFLMVGLSLTIAAGASLLSNFEIVATALIAMLFFKESIGKRLWLAISLITLSSIILSADAPAGFSFSAGSLFVLLACICWGLENNCTRKLSLKDPLQIVIIKGLSSGLGSLLIALLILSEKAARGGYIFAALLLGFFSYGLSIFFYVYAQRELGAARTSAYYAIAPFVGVALSFLLLGEKPTASFIVALLIMLIGTYFAISEKHKHLHTHPQMIHEHRHSHDDGHHNHKHDASVKGEHSHPHRHEELEHEHSHTNDIHHDHPH